MENNNVSSGAFAWKQRIGLGVTEFGRNIGDFMIMSYLMLYLTDIAAISLMFLLCRIFDAFTDYMVGVLVDRTRTKLGRSKPWMYVGAFVLAVRMKMEILTTPVMRLSAWQIRRPQRDSFSIISFWVTCPAVGSISFLPEDLVVALMQ